MNLDGVIEVCEKYMELRARTPYGYGNNASEYIETANKLKALGREWGDPLCVTDFRMAKGYYLTNSATHYKQNKDTYYIQWDNGNVGRLMFTGDRYWAEVTDEWNDFLTEMREGALDYDPLNCHIIYDIETGKKKMEDYQELCDRTRKRINEKTRLFEIRRMEKELEALRGKKI